MFCLNAANGTQACRLNEKELQATDMSTRCPKAPDRDDKVRRISNSFVCAALLTV
jgi:hypothetical protein